MPKPVDVSTPSDLEIRVARAFDAPAKLVWDCHTKPELLRRWMLGPPGWSMPVCEIDLKVGGAYRYVWRRDKDGHEMAMGGVFREIVPPERVVTTEKFDDPWYAGEALVTNSLAEHDGRTTLTCTMLLDSREVRDGILKSGMESGVAVSYDRLDEVLASMPARGAA